MGGEGGDEVNVKAQVTRMQNAMAAKILGWKAPGELVGYQEAPGGQVPVFRKRWRDNNRYQPPYKSPRYKEDRR